MKKKLFITSISSLLLVMCLCVTAFAKEGYVPSKSTPYGTLSGVVAGQLQYGNYKECAYMTYIGQPVNLVMARVDIKDYLTGAHVGSDSDEKPNNTKAGYY